MDWYLLVSLFFLCEVGKILTQVSRDAFDDKFIYAVERMKNSEK